MQNNKKFSDAEKLLLNSFSYLPNNKKFSDAEKLLLNVLNSFWYLPL
jgi:hypothetical protein